MEQKFEHHTIVNKDVVNKLINNANIKKNDIILEIGPGNGVITKELCKFSKKVISVEKDINCREFLDILLNKNSNLEVIYSNVLDIIIPNFDKLIANLPFNVFEPLIYKLSKIDFNCAVIIIGNDSAKNLTLFNSESKTSVFSRCYFNTEIICELEKDDFSPEPRAIPTIIKMIKKKRENIDDKLLYILRKLFDQRDKKIKNALVESLINNKFNKDEKLTQNVAKKILEQFDLNNEILEKSISLISNQNINILIQKLKEYLCK